jgi:hypothetical protein
LRKVGQLFLGGYEPKNLNNRWNFEATHLTQLSFWKRFERLFLDVALNLPLFAEMDEEFDNARIRNGLEKRKYKVFDLCKGMAMLANTFFPFNVKLYIWACTVTN